MFTEAKNRLLGKFGLGGKDKAKTETDKKTPSDYLMELSVAVKAHTSAGDHTDPRSDEKSPETMIETWVAKKSHDSDTVTLAVTTRNGEVISTSVERTMDHKPFEGVLWIGSEDNPIMTAKRVETKGTVEMKQPDLVCAAAERMLIQINGR